MHNKSINHILIRFHFIIIACCLVTFIPRFSLSETQEPELNESLSIVNSVLHHSIVEDHNYISCIGKMKNSSNVAWDEPVIEVQFFNSKNELIDTFTEYIYGMVVPPHEEVAFKIKDGADKNIKEYISHKVRITSAQPIMKYKTTKSKSNTLTKILISWFPMLLLIAVWLFFMKKYQGKNSPQNKIIAIQEKQYLLIEQQNILFEKLIDAIKNK